MQAATRWPRAVGCATAAATVADPQGRAGREAERCGAARAEGSAEDGMAEVAGQARAGLAQARSGAAALAALYLPGLAPSAAPPAAAGLHPVQLAASSAFFQPAAAPGSRARDGAGAKSGLAPGRPLGWPAPAGVGRKDPGEGSSGGPSAGEAPRGARGGRRADAGGEAAGAAACAGAGPAALAPAVALQTARAALLSSRDSRRAGPVAAAGPLAVSAAARLMRVTCGGWLSRCPCEQRCRSGDHSRPLSTVAVVRGRSCNWRIWRAQ